MNENATMNELVSGAPLAELGPGPRQGRLSEPDVREAFSRWNESGPADGRLLLALALLWHDHLDAAHVIAQDVDHADGSYVHALVHRREPDYWNSKYWFRRVGAHPVFAALGPAASAILASAADLKSRLLPGNRWDPMAFVDACERAAGEGSRSASTEDTRLLQSIQQVEFRLMGEHLLRNGRGG